MPLSVIEAEHDWNLNLRRYVDNTPPPEPEDVRCHLHGGVPRAEVDGPAATKQLTKFKLSAACVFDALDAERFAFKPELTDSVMTTLRAIFTAETATAEKLSLVHPTRFIAGSHDLWASQVSAAALPAGQKRTTGK